MYYTEHVRGTAECRRLVAAPNKNVTYFIKDTEGERAQIAFEAV